MTIYHKKEISRREFLDGSARIAAGLIAASTVGSFAAPRSKAAAGGRVIGANERINLAVLGIRSRGMSMARRFPKIPNVCVKTLVDVDENLFPERVKEIEEIQGFAPSTEYDLRRCFDDKDIDAVVIATTDHWHALATIWACQAGKHVYVEKPCSHNIWEGRKMIEAARKYNRIVAVGFQSRSESNIRQAIKFLHDGIIGEVYMARGLCFKPRDSIGRYPDGPVPLGEKVYRTIGGKELPTCNEEYLKKVHYDLWLGPAPKRPFNRNRFHYNWHWYWDYGCGDIGNQGPHELDIARWGLNEKSHPIRVRSVGGFFAFDSDQETPNTQTAVYEYADGKLLQFEVRGLYTNTEGGIGDDSGGKRCIGNLFYGSKGWMAIEGGIWKTYFGRKNEPGPSSETVEQIHDPMNLAGTGGEPHYNNFINALRSGNSSVLTSDIESGNISTVLNHLANISYRLGARQLTFDGKKEQFINDEEANRFLIRKYREQYIVPEKV